MKASSRKIFKKIGAGLMLGLSLFNLGAAWNKTEGWNTAKRSKKLRVKEKDQIDAELVIFAEVAEEEAEKAMKERSASQKEQVVEKNEITFAQKVYRTSAVGLLSIALGIFATSMIFNSPFSLGKGLLSLLPGSPHMAVLSLFTEQEQIDAGEDITVIARLDSAGERVDDLKLVIGYNPNFVSFSNDNSFAGWKISEERLSDGKTELTFLSEEELFSPRVFLKEEFVRVKFKSKKTAVNNNLMFTINQSRSLVVSKENGLSRNILGNVNGLKVSVSNKLVQLMKCQKIKEMIGGIDFWKNFVQGNSFDSREIYWQELDRSTGMICAYSGNYGYIAIVTPSDQEINYLEVESSGLKENFDKAHYEWEKDGFDFYVYQIPLAKILKNDFRMNFKGKFFEKKQWPIEGNGRITLDN